MRHLINEHIRSEFSLLNKKELASLLGCTTRTVDRMLAARQIPLSIIAKIPAGANGGLKTRFIYGRTVEWIQSLTGPMKQNAETN